MNRSVLNLLPKPKRENRSYRKIVHFLDRWQQRMGYRLSDQEYWELNERLKERGRHVASSIDGDKLYKTEWNGIDITVVYSGDLKFLITVWTNNEM